MKKDRHRIYKELGFIYIVGGKKFTNKTKAEKYLKQLNGENKC